MIHYKSVSALKTKINGAINGISRAKNEIIAKEKILDTVGIKLYSQFCHFANLNKDLYDDEFLKILKNKKFSIKEIAYCEEKSAVRIIVNIVTEGIQIILIPFLFIKDQKMYKITRMRMLKMGKDATIEDVEKHYNEEICELMKKIKSLEDEKQLLTGNDKDWN